MKDIANELGVSVALVSYVLNGKKTNKINARTAARIKALAAKMNYTPNQIAKSLKTNRTNTLGLIVADISNLFYSSIAKYIEEEASAYGYQVIYGSAHESRDRFEQLLNVLLARQVDGLILAIPENAEKSIHELTCINKPFVVIDRKFKNAPKAPSILLDNYDASQQIVKHMAANGYKRPGLITINRKLCHLKERKDGFATTCKELLKKLPFVYELHEEKLEEEMHHIIRRSLYEDKVDSLCFFTNKIAMAGLSEIAALDVEVPGTLGVVCFDEAEAYKLFKTPVSYLKQPIETMSKAAVSYLINRIEHPKEKPSITIKEFKGTLVVKESSSKRSLSIVKRKNQHLVRS
jgi:Transcriptional regulators